jgi:tRNA 5-methylaminomethyl-2-thiouridine biosynthesis bifunctional protein
MTPDHLPIVGAMPNIEQHKKMYAHLAKDKNWRYQEPAPVIENLFVLTGLGARGLCTAPLLAEILTADLTGEDYPVGTQELFNLSPNRFVIRDIIRRKFI